MEKTIGLGVFGTLGNPNGYQQSFFLNAQFPQNLDLNPNAVEVFPGSELFAVRKDFTKGVLSQCFCIYSFAREYQSNRRGTFLGNCVVLNNYGAGGESIHNCLRELHADTVQNSKNILNNVIQVQHIRDVEVKEPLNFSQLTASAVPVSPGGDFSDPKRSLFIAADKIPAGETASAVSDFFRKAMADFRPVPVLYFSASPEIARYVREQGLIPVIDWEVFKKQQYQSGQGARKKTPVRTGATVAGNVAAASNGEERFQPSEFIFRPWKAPMSPWDVHETQRRIAEHNNIIQQYEKLENELAKLKSVIEEEGLTHRFAFLNRNKLALFLSAAGFVAIVLGYLGLRPDIPKDKITIQTTADTIALAATTNVKQEVPVLNPLPNNRLPEEEVAIVTKEGVMGKTIEEVVQLLFHLNPTDIRKHYSGQEKFYAQVLMERNKDCFKSYNNLIVCHCSTLTDIPIYK